jgi:hypothetical protein
VADHDQLSAQIVCEAYDLLDRVAEREMSVTL